jgi:hypothetical protein
MAEAQKRSSGWSTFILGLVAIAFVVLLLLLPASYMERIYTAEREAVQTLLGDAEEAIYATSYFAPSQGVMDSMDSFSQDFGREKPISLWASARLTVLWMWGNLVNYRLAMLFAWMLSFLPFILAALIDGYYVREARKYTFYSQSPIRHKVGVRTAVAVFGITLICVGLPLVIPPIVTPVALISIGCAAWLWMSNLQKRL